ncbi:MAG: DUF3344 domain-containing protein [Methanosarcinales archaeon]
MTLFYKNYNIILPNRTLIKRTIIIICLFFAFSIQAQANYTGDKPLIIHTHDTITGDLVYTIGSSYYKNLIGPEIAYEVTHNISIPQEATVQFARLYVYWTWSKINASGCYPDLKLIFNNNELSLYANYSDRKEFDPYDYPGGNRVYDVTDTVTSSGSYHTLITNIGPDGSKFAINGVGLLLVYTDPAKNEMEYWIAEGCDYLSSRIGSGLTPEESVTQLELSGSINLSNICEAELTTVVQSGCHENNSLIFNHKNWTGLYNGTPYTNLDINNLDVRNYLTANNNIIKFRAVDDYMAPSNVFLVLKHTTPSSEPTPVPTDNSSVMSLTTTIEPAVSIKVSPVSLNFGTLGLGTISENHQIIITSLSPDTIRVIPEVTDTAQDLFVNGLLINNTLWSNYQIDLNPNSTQETYLNLKVPDDYQSTGDKEGTLIFWAQQQ